MRSTFSLAFIGLVAGVPIFTSAVPSRISRSLSGIAIPLTKRYSEVQGGEIKRALTHLSRKYKRNFEAYARNTGRCHPNDFQPQLNARNLGYGAIGQEYLLDSNEDVWEGVIQVGTPPTELTVDFDTGSSDLYISGPKCNSSCDGYRIYHPDASSTARDRGQNFTLKYGDGSGVLVDLYTDTVSIAGLTLTNQSLGVVTQNIDSNATTFSPDGLLGLGFPDTAVYTTSPFFQTLIEQGVITVPQFSFKFGKTGSELFLGGSNSELYTGEFTDLPLSKKGLWQVDLDGIKVAGNTTTSAAQALIDTGTTLVVGPIKDVISFYDAIPGSRKVKLDTLYGNGTYTFPCDSALDISLTFGGKDFAIPKSLFSQGPLSPGSSDCTGGIVGLEDLSIWIVGDLFLRNVYTRFDVGAKQIGFAKLA